jgi:purine-binding chemotaxis protein CheW
MAAIATGNVRQGKYLVFHLGREEYGVQVMKVREIMGIQEITTVPQTPEYVMGVINLRGKVVPVIDLRAKFGLACEEYTARTCIIVVQVEQSGQALQVGVIVDGVSEVLVVQESDVEDAPRFGDETEIPYILGMAKVKGKVKILLDIDKALALDGVDNGLALSRLHEKVAENRSEKEQRTEVGAV